MSTDEVPTAQTPSTHTHEPPSLPNSPLPKRTKRIDPAPFPPSTGALLPAAGTESGTATPTPTPLSGPPSSLTHSSMAGLHAAADDDMDVLQVKLLHADATAPTKGSVHAAGHDLYAAVDVVVPARGRALVGTGISVKVPGGTYGRVAPRSGLAHKHGIDTLAGVIDADYRGPVGVILANFSDEDFAVKKGDRVAQLVVERIAMPRVVVVAELEESGRGQGGFGSTGGFGVGGVASAV
ncbi:Deoxyuridine 5'-triphosphate nucleotidohydrolase [Coniothyrium glycines]